MADKLLLDSVSGDFLFLQDDGTGPPPTVADVLLLEAAAVGGATILPQMMQAGLYASSTA